MPSTISDLSQLSAQALDQFKKSLNRSNGRQGDPRITAEISKAAGISQATGLVWYDLQTPAKQLFPVLTPLRNKIPRTAGGGGTATNWVSVTGINTAGLRGFVPEGVRNGLVTTATSPKSATYKGLGLEDAVTFEAELAAENFENVRSTTGQRLLWATMIEEELSDLGANGSAIALGTPVVAATAAAAGGTIALAAHYYVNVVALTLHGYLGATLAAMPGLTSVTPADGSAAFTFGGGASIPSNQIDLATLTVTSDWGISASVTPIAGAFGYAWFVGTSTSNGKCQQITTGNSALITSYVTASRATLPTNSDDYSKNALAYDGLLYQALAANSGAYVKTLATGTPGTGTGLTADGHGGIVEIDELFKDRWDSYRLPVDEIYVNSQEAQNITKKILGDGATYPNMHIMVEGGQQGQSNLVGGARVASILNKFAMAGKQDVPIIIHPNMPAGTMMGVTWNLPYPVNNVPNVVEKKLRRDYYQMEWPLRTRKYESGVYFDGVLAVYFPPCLSIINNIANR